MSFICPPHCEYSALGMKDGLVAATSVDSQSIANNPTNCDVARIESALDGHIVASLLTPTNSGSGSCSESGSSEDDQGSSAKTKTRTWSSRQEAESRDAFQPPVLKRSKSSQDAPLYRSPVDEDDYVFEMVPFTSEDFDDGCSPYYPSWPSSPAPTVHAFHAPTHSRMNSQVSAAQSVPTPSPSSRSESTIASSPHALSHATVSWYELPLSCVDCAIQGTHCAESDPYLSDYFDGEPPYMPRDYPYASDADCESDSSA